MARLAARGGGGGGRQGCLLPGIAIILTSTLIAGFILSGPLGFSDSVVHRLRAFTHPTDPFASHVHETSDTSRYGSSSLRSPWSWSSIRFGRHSSKTPVPAEPATPSPAKKWLLTVHTSPDQQMQRNLVRSTWMRMYPYPACDFKFLLGSWTSEWDALLEAENATYGDLWSMPSFPEMEDLALANRVKNWEFLPLLVQWAKEGRVGRYAYVSKIDSDLFLNIPEFWDSVMAGRVEGRVNNTRTLIGVMCAYFGGIHFEYACGRMYTMSWDLVELYAELYSREPVRDTFEDVLTGRLLRDHNETFHPVWIDSDRMDDLTDEMMERGEEGVIQSDTISVHRLKDAQKFLSVASFFDEKGYNGNQQDVYTRAEPYLRQNERLAAEAALRELEAARSELEDQGVGGLPEGIGAESGQHELRLVKDL